MLLLENQSLLEKLIGQTIDQKYSIEKKLGQGGMGAVYLANHLGTSRSVALKIIAPQFMSNEELVDRFRLEAKATGQLKHPNVVNVTDFGFTTIDNKPLAYLVMEYLNGSSLSDFLEGQEKLPLALVVDIVEQIALAINQAHSKGIIHRDLKPDNIWLEPNGRGGYNIKVLDFGLAKIRAASKAISAKPKSSKDLSDMINQTLDSGLTQTGEILGTPVYMSPEQVLGEEITPQTDIYSLGVIIYKMLSGETPFTGSSQTIMIQHIQAPAPDIRLKVPNLPKSLSELLSTALAKTPSERPSSAIALASALRARTEDAGNIFRQSFTFYSEHFPLFIKLSFFANIPLLFAAVVLLVLIPILGAGLKEILFSLAVISFLVTYTFAVHRATYAIVLEQLLKGSLEQLDFSQVIARLRENLALSAGHHIDLFLVLKLFQLTLIPNLPLQNIFRVPIYVMEGTANIKERSKLLTSRVKPVLRKVAFVSIFMYFIPMMLFFFSAFGISKLLEIQDSLAIHISFIVSMVITAMNLVWLIVPMHVAVTMLYFKARQAGGETLENPTK